MHIDDTTIGSQSRPPEPLRIESTPEPKPAAAQSGRKAAQGAQPQTETQATQTAQAAKPKPQAQQQRTQHRDDVPRPPRGIFPSGGSPFGLFRF